ncbi:hypothetical protein AB9L18_10325 [Stenotrophomonas lactitubi]|uniref:hypothetical protein n=1 Tax=Stenotrophomonas lactitubi TaxID=2045214 RepID=UPI0035BF1B32
MDRIAPELNEAPITSHLDEVLGESIAQLRRVLHWVQHANRQSHQALVPADLTPVYHDHGGARSRLIKLPASYRQNLRSYALHATHLRRLLDQMIEELLTFPAQNELLDSRHFRGATSRQDKTWTILRRSLLKAGIELPPALGEGVIDVGEFSPHRVWIDEVGPIKLDRLGVSWQPTSSHLRDRWDYLAGCADRAMLLLHDIKPKISFEQRNLEIAVASVVLSAAQLILSAAMAIYTVDCNRQQATSAISTAEEQPAPDSHREQLLDRCSGLLDQLEQNERRRLELVLTAEHADVLSTTNHDARVIDRAFRNQCVIAVSGESGWLKVKYRNRVEERDVEGWLHRDNLRRL